VSEAIIVATIAAVGGILAALFQGMRKENKNDHNVVSDSLNRIENKLDNHIDEHLRGDI
jgi:hypothetical protein